MDLSDAVVTLRYLFDPEDGRRPCCLKAADTNDDGRVDISDPVFLLNFLFGGGAEIPSPYPTCGPDPTYDELTCEEYDVCQGIVEGARQCPALPAAPR